MLEQRPLYSDGSTFTLEAFYEDGYKFQLSVNRLLQ